MWEQRLVVNTRACGTILCIKWQGGGQLCPKRMHENCQGYYPPDLCESMIRRGAPKQICVWPYLESACSLPGMCCTSVLYVKPAGAVLVAPAYSSRNLCVRVLTAAFALPSPTAHSPPSSFFEHCRLRKQPCKTRCNCLGRGHNK